MSLDLIPMLVLSLLLLTAGGADVQTAEVILGGTHEATAHQGALIVADAQVTVPADAEVPGPIHILGGETRILGTVDGDVTQLAGRLIIDADARISGTLQYVGGTLEIDPGADIARRTSIEVAPDDPGPVRRFLPAILVTGLLAVVGARRARRRPRSLEHMRDAIGHHPVVSLTVGGLFTVTFLSLFVFMAFTLILLPVSLLGLGVGLIMLGYGVVALGSLVAERLPIDRPGRATATGVVVVMVTFELLSVVPMVGSAVVGALMLAGLGAVVVTYFGLQEFTPASVPD